MTPDLTVGLFGLGFGKRVHIPAFQHAEGYRLAGLCDRPDVLERLDGETAGDARVFSNALTLLEECRPDILSVAVPPEEQGLLVDAGAGKVKAILCEKPVGRSLAKAQELHQTLNSTGTLGVVNFLFRFDPGLRALRNALQDGVVGDPVRIQVTWVTSGGSRQDRPWSWRHDGTHGGILVDFGVHVFDYLRWLMGESVSPISGTGRIRVKERPLEAGGQRKVTAVDDVDVLMEIGGTPCQLTLSNAYPHGNGHRIEIFGSSGRLMLDHRYPFRPQDRSLVCYGVNGEGTPLIIPELPFQSDNEQVSAMCGLLHDLSRVLAGEKRPDLATFEDAIQARATAELALTSLVLSS